MLNLPDMHFCFFGTKFVVSLSEIITLANFGLLMQMAND